MSEMTSTSSTSPAEDLGIELARWAVAREEILAAADVDEAALERSDEDLDPLGISIGRRAEVVLELGGPTTTIEIDLDDDGEALAGRVITTRTNSDDPDGAVARWVPSTAELDRRTAGTIASALGIG